MLHLRCKNTFWSLKRFIVKHPVCVCTFCYYVFKVYKSVLHVLKNNYVASQVISVITIEFGFRTVCRQLFWCGVYGSNTGGHHVRQYPVVGAHSAGTVDSETNNVRAMVTCMVTTLPAVPVVLNRLTLREFLHRFPFFDTTKVYNNYLAIEIYLFWQKFNIIFSHQFCEK